MTHKRLFAGHSCVSTHSNAVNMLYIRYSGTVGGVIGGMGDYGGTRESCLGLDEDAACLIRGEED